MLSLLRFKIKVLTSYFGAVFFPDEEEREDSYKQDWRKRYLYYGIGEVLMIVDDRTGGYVRTSMPWPFNIPAKVYDKKYGETHEY